MCEPETRNRKPETQTWIRGRSVSTGQRRYGSRAQVVRRPGKTPDKVQLPTITWPWLRNNTRNHALAALARGVDESVIQRAGRTGLLGPRTARNSRDGARRSLSIGAAGIEIKRSNTHVEAHIEVFRDAGSIPAASTDRPVRRFAPNRADHRQAPPPMRGLCIPGGRPLRRCAPSRDNAGTPRVWRWVLRNRPGSCPASRRGWVSAGREDRFQARFQVQIGF